MEIQGIIGAAFPYVPTFSLARASSISAIPIAIFIISVLPSASAGDPADFIECYRDCLNGSDEKTHKIFCSLLCGIINMF